MSTQQHDEALHPRETTGKFATKPVSDAAGGLDALGDAAPVPAIAITGKPGPAAQRWAQAFAAIPGVAGSDAELDVVRDREDGFHATARVHDAEYTVSQRGDHSYVVQGVGHPYGGATALMDNLEGTLETGLRQSRTSQLAAETMASVERMCREEHSSELVKTMPAALTREADFNSTVVGFALPGDHMKVTVFGDNFSYGNDGIARAEGQLFAHSPVKDDFDTELTERQVQNRINKVLDAIGPDRAYSEKFLRRYIALARAEQDRRVNTDPLLTPGAGN